MLQHDRERKIVCVGDRSLLFSFCYEGGLRLTGVRLGSDADEWVREPVEPFVLAVCGGELAASSMKVAAVHELVDAADEGVSFDLYDEVYGISARVSVMPESGEWEYLVQLGAQWADEPQNIDVLLPVLRSIGSHGEWRLANNPYQKPNGKSALRLRREYPLPHCCIAPDQRNGLCLDIRTYDRAMAAWNQCRNYNLLCPQDRESLENVRLPVLIENQPVADVVDIRFFAVTEGWPEVWRRWSERMREGMDLSMYRRKDLEWLKTTLFQYWDFGYSEEVFDYEKQRFDVDRLIDDGLEFGGFDAILHWYVYPRLGVDERSQWQFNRDIPDGYESMRAFSRRAHERGVRVFLPYNPWDARPGETPDTVLDELTRVVAETDVDGLFFDTMAAVPEGLRERMDSIRPGIAFCTEGTPESRDAAELITCALDQKNSSGRVDIMPECTLFRYLFPENNGPFASRWLTAEGKDNAVNRAIFNGTGLLLWQDVFGMHLPYSPACRARIRRWKSILLENFDTYTGPHPIPLCDVLQEGLYLNRFESADGKSIIWSLYNAAEHPVEGRLFRIDRAPGKAEELWQDAAFCVEDGVLSGKIESRGIQIFRFSID